MEKDRRIEEISLELFDIDRWFIDNEWKEKKRIDNEWLETDNRWLDYLVECEMMENRKKELKDELATIV